MRTAVYPGSFDPITYGHVDLVKRSLAIADRVVIAVLRNYSKNALFTETERLRQVKLAVKGLRRVEVEAFDGLLVDFLRRRKSTMIIRGLRAVSDFEYEFQMAVTNRRLMRDAETVFMMPAERFTFLSSSVVKEITRLGGSVRGLVPPHVAADLRGKHSGLR